MLARVRAGPCGMSRRSDDADMSLGARLIRSILSDDRLSVKLGGFAAEARAEALSEASAAELFAPRADAPGGGGAEALLPEVLLMHTLEYLDVADVGRCARVSLRWRGAAHAEALWRRLCRRQLAAFHPVWGPLGSAPPLPLSCSASAAAAAGARADADADSAASAPDGNSFFILPPPAALPPPPPPPPLPLPAAAPAAAARASLRAPWHAADDGGGDAGPAARAERAAVARLLAVAAAGAHGWAASADAAAAAYLRSRADLLAEFRAAVSAARSFRHAFPCVAGVRCGGFYQTRHQYIRTGIEDRFHKHDGLLLVVYFRAMRFFRDGSVAYVMTAGRLLDVARQLSRVCAGAAPARGANVGYGRFELHGAALRATVALAQTATVQHWELGVSSDMPRGLFNKLTVRGLRTCDAGAPFESGYAMAELADAEFSFVPVAEWGSG